MRRPMSRLPVNAVTLTASLLPLGCGFQHGWGTVVQRDPEGTYPYAIASLTCDNRVYLILAVDGCSGSSTSTKQGSFTAVDGRIVPWSCTTSDGSGGTVTIAGQQFELGKGAVFLISLKANKMKVEQLVVDMSKVQKVLRGNAEDKLIAFGEAEPRMKAFLKECRDQK
jgi:hypothetical protein